MHKLFLQTVVNKNGDRSKYNGPQHTWARTATSSQLDTDNQSKQTPTRDERSMYQLFATRITIVNTGYQTEFKGLITSTQTSRPQAPDRSSYVQSKNRCRHQTLSCAQALSGRHCAMQRLKAVDYVSLSSIGQAMCE